MGDGHFGSSFGKGHTGLAVDDSGNTYVTDPGNERVQVFGIAGETVRRRWAGLQRDRIYEIVAVPNHRKLGYGVELLLGIEADSDQMDEVAEALSKLDEVYRVSCMTGSFNVFAWLAVRSMNDATNALNEMISDTPGINLAVKFCCTDTKKPWTPIGP